MHRIFGQNQVTFELGRRCLFNGKVYSHNTLIHSYISHFTTHLNNISWIYIIATEQLTPKNYDYQNPAYQIFGQCVSNIRTEFYKVLMFTLLQTNILLYCFLDFKQVYQYVRRLFGQEATCIYRLKLEPLHMACPIFYRKPVMRFKLNS